MTFPTASRGHSGVPAPPASLGLVGFRQLLPNLSSVAHAVRGTGPSRLAGDALQGSSHPAVTQAPLDQGQSLGSGPPPFPALRLAPTLPRNQRLREGPKEGRLFGPDQGPARRRSEDASSES